MMEKLTMLSDIILVSILSASVMLTLIATMDGNKKCKAICIIEALAWLCVVVRMVLASTIANIVINIIIFILIILLLVLWNKHND